MNRIVFRHRQLPFYAESRCGLFDNPTKLARKYKHIYITVGKANCSYKSDNLPFMNKCRLTTVKLP